MIQTIGRNDPCSCLSGLSFEKCCGKDGPFDDEGNMFRVHVPLNDASAPEVGTRAGFVIVKVQTALNDPTHPALVYDRGRALQRHVPVDQVVERMGGRAKVFFYAQLSYGQIVLRDEAPEQGW